MMDREWAEGLPWPSGERSGDCAMVRCACAPMEYVSAQHYQSKQSCCDPKLFFFMLRFFVRGTLQACQGYSSGKSC